MAWYPMMPFKDGAGHSVFGLHELVSLPDAVSNSWPFFYLVFYATGSLAYEAYHFGLVMFQGLEVRKHWREAILAIEELIEEEAAHAAKGLQFIRRNSLVTPRTDP